MQQLGILRNYHILAPPQETEKIQVPKYLKLLTYLLTDVCIFGVQ